jgi:hypothetical protein
LAVGADQVSRDDPCPIPALTAVGGLGGVAVAGVDGLGAWAPATTAATTGGAAGVTAGETGATGVVVDGAGVAGVVVGASDGVRVGVVVDGAGVVVGVVTPVPAPMSDCLRRSAAAPPARIRLAVTPDAGVTVPAAGEVNEPLAEPVAGAPVVGVPPEGEADDGSEVDGDAASAEDGVGVVPWTATTLAAEVVGAELPGTARATPTATATRTTAVTPRTLRACTPGNGPSPTSHRSHCFKA